MKLHAAAVAILTLSLSACGGGGGGGSGSGSGGGATQSQASAAFVAPVQGEKRVYTTTLVNLDGATATYNVYEQIAQVNADASYTANWSEDNYTIDGGNYGSDPYSQTYNSVGDVISQTDVVGDVCNFTFASGGRPAVMQPGQTWDDSSVAKCSPNNSTYTTTLEGTYLGVETVNVPAGSYLAYKFQLVQPYGSGTLTFTYWYDTSTADSRLVREFWQYDYGTQATSGEMTNHVDFQLASY